MAEDTIGYVLSMLFFGWLIYYFGLRFSSDPVFLRIVDPGRIVAPLVRATARSRLRKKGTPEDNSVFKEGDDLNAHDLKRTQIQFIGSFLVLMIYCAVNILSQL